MPPHPARPLEAYDYAAVEQERGKFPQAWQEIVEAGRVEKIKEFEGDRGAGISIYRVLPRRFFTIIFFCSVNKITFLEKNHALRFVKNKMDASGKLVSF